MFISHPTSSFMLGWRGVHMESSVHTKAGAVPTQG